MFKSYKDQSPDLRNKSTDWFLKESKIGHKWINRSIGSNVLTMTKINKKHEGKMKVSFATGVI